MNFDHLIIDGYNLLHQDEALDDRRDDLQTARQRLVRRVERAAPEMAPRISVVFDGREGGRDASFDAPHLEVLFSPANRTADAVIERMVAEAKKPERICVVTSDRSRLFRRRAHSWFRVWSLPVGAMRPRVRLCRAVQEKPAVQALNWAIFSPQIYPINRFHPSLQYSMIPAHSNIPFFLL